ncbi:MAG: hypothetical protein GY755_14940 [Chloroflexi bacterium]|nr:hypothetical protein [Chloroflexota bacterium]
MEKALFDVWIVREWYYNGPTMVSKAMEGGVHHFEPECKWLGREYSRISAIFGHFGTENFSKAAIVKGKFSVRIFGTIFWGVPNNDFASSPHTHILAGRPQLSVVWSPDGAGLVQQCFFMSIGVGLDRVGADWRRFWGEFWRFLAIFGHFWPFCHFYPNRKEVTYV